MAKTPEIKLGTVEITTPKTQILRMASIIWGPSGAGKTTIAHLLMRFWDPTQGEIRFAGQPLGNYQLSALRASIALVAQDTYLFNDTLEANIRIARPDAVLLVLRLHYPKGGRLWQSA